MEPFVSLFRKSSMIISKEKQQELAAEIETAFKIGSGHYFMQRNDFQDIIAVHKSEIATKEKESFELFVLADINRPVTVKPVEAIQEPVKPYKHIPHENSYFNLLDEYPEFYNHCGL